MQELDYKIIASLEAQEHVEDIAARLGVNKSKVLRVKIKYDKAIIAGTLDELVDVNQLVMHNAVNASKEQIPTLKESISNLGQDIKDSSERLAKLDEELMSTALFVNTRIRSLISTSQEVSEIEGLVNSVCKLRDTFFNKNVTQVNIQNNLSNSGAAAYGDWLSDKAN